MDPPHYSNTFECSHYCNNIFFNQHKLHLLQKVLGGKKLNALIYLFFPVKMATLVIHYK